MDRDALRDIVSRLRRGRSRRQFLAGVAKGTIGGLGAAMASRRLDGEFLAGGSARAGGTLVTEQSITLAQASTPYVRRNVHTLEAGSTVLDSYANAVAAMKLLPQDDPLSWAYQANIHEMWTSPPPPEPPPTSELDGWTTCEHFTQFFWPWHRMYLYWFERIIRSMSGDDAFALPYWDYSDPTWRVLPAPFRDSTSSLYTDQRNFGLNTETPPGTGDEPTFSYCPGLNQSSFNSAADSIEDNPHGGVHIWVGGWMGDFPTAGRDPIFWLHHANIDRLWESWMALGGTNPTNTAWRERDANSVNGREYNFFDETGTKVDTVRVVEQVLNISELGYSYERLAVLSDCEFLLPPPGGIEGAAPPEATPVAPVELGGNAPEGGIEVGPAPATVPVSLGAPEAALEATAAGGMTLLTIEGVQGTGVPAVAVEVYINLPPDVEADFRTPYYVGNLNLFGLLSPDSAQHEMARLGMTQQFDITRNVAALDAAGEWTDALEVTLVPRFIGAVEEPGAVPEGAAASPEAAAVPEGPWVTVDGVSLSTG
jgi:tyrosinase